MKPQGILSTVTLLALNLASCTAGLWGSSSSSNGAAAANEATPEAPPFKHDYKMSFKKPFYYNGTVPFWKTGGAVIQADDFIRLAPSVPNTKGWIWSDNTNPYESWEVEVAFKVTGNQMHGGRGLAFWYTKDKMIDGPIFGARDQWDGLSIWLDSANPKTHTPTTMVLLNDGTRAFATNTDPTKYMLGSCSMNYRNTVIPSYLKVAYKDGTLTVALDTNGQGSDYRVCVQRSGIKLPSGYYFGLSAASRHPADDHDVISWETKQLNPPAKAQKYKRPLEDEKIRQGEEFRELSDAQKKKIEETEFKLRQMREAAEGDEVKGETIATLGAIYDTQRRALENLQMVQLQIEALGAPPLQDILEGKVEKRTGGSGVQTTMVDISSIAEKIQQESRSLADKVDQQTRDQEKRLRVLQDTVTRLEKIINNMDTRMAIQSTNMQNKINEMTKDSAEAKGTMSNLLKYTFYAFGSQAIVVIAGYAYWKLRIERNEKKYL